jgi:hypothetical protein
MSRSRSPPERTPDDTRVRGAGPARKPVSAKRWTAPHSLQPIVSRVTVTQITLFQPFPLLQSSPAVNRLLQFSESTSASEIM